MAGSLILSLAAAAATLLGLCDLAQASVVVLPGGLPRPYMSQGAVLSRDEFFRQSAEHEFYNYTGTLIQTSHDGERFAVSDGFRPSGDSFVRGAIQAWAEHLHLVVRPDEVWFTVLTQMNFYMQAHAEELRGVFVGGNASTQEVIYVEDTTWQRVLARFQGEIQKRVRVPWLAEWISPGFTTTTDSDRLTATVLLMGLTKAYFKFEGGIICGLPSVTLLGERRDWERLLAKLDRLADFGEEPKAYAARLRPILSRFVATFADPDGADTLRFWNSVATADKRTVCGQPPYIVSGWITGFHHWDARGRLARPFGQPESVLRVTLDNVTYPVVDLRELPVGYAKVPFLIRDYYAGRPEFPAYLMAGTLGKKVRPGTPPGYAAALARTGKTDPVPEGERQDRNGREVHNTLQPLSGWLMYGPADYNRTTALWGGLETEDLLVSLKDNYNAPMCHVKT